MLGIIKDRYLFFKEVEFLVSQCDSLKDALEVMRSKIPMKDINAIKDNQWSLLDLREHLKERSEFWHAQCDFSREIKSIKQ